MRIERVQGCDRAVAAMLGTTVGRLRTQDEHAGATDRWLATVDGEPAALMTARRRPDRRVFLTYAGRESLVGPLTEAGVAALGRPVFTTVEGDDGHRVQVLTTAGFRVEVVTERFVVPFDRAVAALARARPPDDVTIIGADAADPLRLFALDNAIRNDVPGCDGWEGNERWFRGELSPGPPFDPSAYLVAVDDASAEYIGLVRIWRNPSGPRLGLVGVVPSHRGSMVAPWLLRGAIGAAADWGHAAFSTDSSPSNTAVHPHLVRLGAASAGRLLQMVNPWRPG